MRVRDTKPGWAWMRVDAQALPSGKGVFYLSQKQLSQPGFPRLPRLRVHKPSWPSIVLGEGPAGEQEPRCEGHRRESEDSSVIPCTASTAKSGVPPDTAGPAVHVGPAVPVGQVQSNPDSDSPL